MCGQFGFFGDPYQQSKDAMQLLFQFNELRGAHSTGLGVIKHDWTLDVRKSLEPAYDFVRNPRNMNIATLNTRGWIGHCRYATKGAVSRLNAHPFVVDDTLLGVHNGTIRNVTDMDHHADFGTDSEALYNMVYDHGVQEALSRVQGAWALIYADTTTRTFNVVRNKERTLYMARQKNNKGVWFASEAWMLSVALSKAGIEVGSIELVPEDTLMMFDDWTHKDGVPEPTLIKEVKGKAPVFIEPTVYRGWTGNGSALHDGEKPIQPWVSHYFKGWEWHNESKGWIDPERKQAGLNLAATKVKQKEAAAAKQAAPKDTPLLTVVPKDGTVVGYKKEQLSKEQWDHIKKKGCLWCDDPVEDRAKAIFIGPTAIVCDDCVHDNHEEIPSGELIEEGEYILQEILANFVFNDDTVEDLKKAIN